MQLVPCSAGGPVARVTLCGPLSDSLLGGQLLHVVPAIRIEHSILAHGSVRTER
jgi:hypothetical protein